MHNRTQRNTTFFEELAYKYLPYKPLFIGLSVLFLLLAFVYLRYATPIYEASATILIKDEKKGSDESQVSESLNFLSAKKIVENEVVVIQSRNLIDGVVKELRLYAPVSQKGKIKDRFAYTSSPIIITAEQPEKIEASEKIFFTYDSTAKTVTIDDKVYPLNSPAVTPFGTLVFSANPSFVEKTDRPLYFQLQNPRLVADAVAKKLDVRPVGKLSSIVKLKLLDEEPQRAEDILNNLIRDYNAASINYKNTMAQNTIAFVDERMGVVQRELNAVEKQIQNYKSKKGIVDLSEQGRQYLQNVGDNDQKLAELNMKLAVLDQVEKYVSVKDNNEGIVPSTLGINDPVLTGLLDKLYQAELNRGTLKKTTAENHPSMLAVEEQIEKIRPSILENIRSQRNSLQASRQNLTRTNATYNSILQSIPQKERELLDVSREQSIKNSIYSFLLQKREETAISFGSNIADSKIVESARASILPVSPNKLFVFPIAIVLALLVSIAYVAYKEMLSGTILFRHEIEKYTNVPVVGEIANIKNVEKNILKGHSDPIISEQFRQLRIAAGLFSKSSLKRKILVTSSIPGEGKSLVSTNLAINLSLSGKRVVLLDLDLHNPQSSKNMGIEDAIGIGEYLERDIEPYEIIKGTEYNNLHVVPAGKVTANATELLLNGKLAHFFDYIEEAFDFIIIDTSPVNPLTDAYILSDYCDLTLYVVRHGYTPKTFIEKLDETNAIKKLNNMAIVFNAVKPRGFVKNNFGYGFGYDTPYRYKIASKTGIKGLLQKFQSSFRKTPVTKA